MTTILSEHYDLLNVHEGCSDAELRSAYRRLMLSNHPDKNPDDIEAATLRARSIVEAYHTLRIQRSQPAGASSADDGSKGVVICFRIGFEGSSGDSRELLRAIQATKGRLRDAWRDYYTRQHDPFAALQLVGAAILANRQDVVNNLLRNPELTALAPTLLDHGHQEAQIEAMKRWADVLTEGGEWELAIQLLEDSMTRSNDRRLASALGDLHYRAAQGYLREDGNKPKASERIHHLNQLLHLGRKFSYVYKLLAEACHETGDDVSARQHLEEAFRLEPQLSGAVKISRALGFQRPTKADTTTNTPTKQREDVYRFKSLPDLPSVGDVEAWASQMDWKQVVAAAELRAYAPRLLPKARNVVREAAYRLHGAGLALAEMPLADLATCMYWDVRHAALMSLAMVGDKGTLKYIGKAPIDSGGDQVAREGAFKYLKARLHWSVAHDLSTLQVRALWHNHSYLECATASQVLLERYPADETDRSELIALHALACSEVGLPEHAYYTAKHVIGLVEADLQSKLTEAMPRWIQSIAFWRSYDPQMDADYLFVTRSLFEKVLQSETMEMGLGTLYGVTRWVEMIGDGETAQWVRQLLREEAPATGYADEHDRVNYVREATWTASFRDAHETLVASQRVHVIEKIMALVGERRLTASRRSRRRLPQRTTGSEA